MEVYACSDTGRVRAANQDAYRLLPLGPAGGALFLAVADGMGGAAGGETASRLAVETVFARVESEYPGWSEPPAVMDGLRKALEEAHETLVSHQHQHPALMGMGTTFTGVLIRNSRLYFAHTGDSRAYLCQRGTLRRMTDDHSVVGELVRRGSLTEDEAQHHPQRNLLTSALGTQGPLELDIRTDEWAPGDMLLLCSDGLTSLVSDDELQAVLAEPGSDPARRLVDLANERGGNDNITVLAVLHPGPGSPEPGGGKEEVNP